MDTEATNLDQSELEDTPAVPQVSIGMPVYNGEPFIREALDSLLAQTFPDFELIISDNASTDGTEAICWEYAAKDKRIRYVRQVENSGPVANFQFVLDEALGGYFMWAAADDVWDRQWIAALLPVVRSCQCLVYGRVATIDGDGQRIPHPANDRSFDFQGPRLIRRMWYSLLPPFQGKANPIYGLMPQNIITNDDFAILGSSTYGSDMLFLYNLLRKTQIRSVASVFLQKRIHSGCSGGGSVIRSKSRQPLVGKLLRFGQSLLVSQFRKYTSYSLISTPMERALLMIFIPVTFVLDGLNSVSWFVSSKKLL